MSTKIKEYYQILNDARPDFDTEIPLWMYDSLEKAGVLRDSREYSIDEGSNRYCKIGLFEKGFSVASKEYSK